MKFKSREQPPLVIIYCTTCGFRLFDNMYTGEVCIGAVRMTWRSIAAVRGAGTCSYCDGRLDAKELPEG